MIISQRRNYIFVHIPKTGGTSFALALEGRAAKDDILIGDTPKALRRRRRLKNAQAKGRLWKHSTLADIEGLVAEDFIARAFVVTLVRNPWDRLVSYYHWLQTQAFDHPAVSVAKTTTFTEFLQTRSIQQAFEQNPYGHYVTTAYHEERCDAFVRLEHLAEDTEPFWEHLGFELQVGLTNQSARKADYQSYYTSETAELVGHICATDIARFGYVF